MSTVEEDSRVMPAVRRNVPRAIAGLLVLIVFGATVWMLATPVTTRVHAEVRSEHGVITITDANGQRVVEGDTLDFEVTNSPLGSALADSGQVTVTVGYDGGEGSCNVTGAVPYTQTASGPSSVVRCYYHR